MKWSFRLGTLFGIPVFVHGTFLLLLGFLGLMQLVQAGLAAAMLTVLLISAVFGSVVLHEFGHALAARRFGIATQDVTLLPIGGLARLDRMPREPRQELLIALAGPAVNIAIAGVLALWVALFGGAFAFRLMSINLGLAAFNMLPAFPMDGGRVLRAMLARRVGFLSATRTAATIGKGMALLFGLAGMLGNPMLIFIALFVWFGAGQEALLAERAPWFGRPAQPMEPTVVWSPDGSYRSSPRFEYDARMDGPEPWRRRRADVGRRSRAWM